MYQDIPRNIGNGSKSRAGFIPERLRERRLHKLHLTRENAECDRVGFEHDDLVRKYYTSCHKTGES